MTTEVCDWVEFKVGLQQLSDFLNENTESDPEYDKEIEPVLQAIERLQKALHAIHSIADVSEEVQKATEDDIEIVNEYVKNLKRLIEQEDKPLALVF